MCFVQYLSEKTVVEKSGFVIDIQGKESNHRSKIKANGEFLKLRQIHYAYLVKRCNNDEKNRCTIPFKHHTSKNIYKVI